MKFALTFYGHLFDSIPFSTYTSNVIRTTEIVLQSWKYKDVIKTAHLSGTRVADLMHFFDVTHTFTGASTTFKRAREELADAFKLLETERASFCMLVRIDAYLEELSRPNLYSTYVIHNQYGSPWDGLLVGKVASLKSCSMHTRVTGSPQYQIAACCQFLKCQQFARYTVRWTRPPGEEALQNGKRRQEQTFSRTSQKSTSPTSSTKREKRDMLSERGVLNTTAVLMTGGVRALMYTEISSKLKLRVLKPLQADLFLYLDMSQVETTTDRHTCEHRSEVPHDLLHVNITSIAEYLQPKLYGTFDDCKAFGNVPIQMGEAAESFFQEEEQSPERLWKTAGASLRPVNCSYIQYRSKYAQFLWAEKGYNLIKLHEHQRAQKYDWILRMRPELVFSIPVKNPQFTYSQSKVVFGYPLRQHLLLSWWAMIPRVVSDTYFKIGQAMKHCDLLTFGLDRASYAAECDGLDRYDVDCFLRRWLLSNSIRLDRVYGKHFETSLVHIVGGKRSVVTSIQINSVVEEGGDKHMISQ